MENNKTIQVNDGKPPLPPKYIVAAICSVLILFVALAAPTSVMRAKLDPFSGDVIIRKYAARQLSEIYGDRLSYGDFAKITEFDFKNYASNNPRVLISEYSRVMQISDIGLLRKFSNLEELDLSYIRYPEIRIPKWMKYLNKIGILDIKKKFAIDLDPLKNLSDLRSLLLSSAQIYDISPLKDLVNLEELYIDNTQVSDLEPLKGLAKLSALYITGCENITDEQVEDLQKALPDLKIYK